MKNNGPTCEELLTIARLEREQAEAMLKDEERASLRLQTALDASEMLRRDMALEIERLKRILTESE